MADEDTPRRSGRKRTVNTRFLDNAVDFNLSSSDSDHGPLVVGDDDSQSESFDGDAASEDEDSQVDTDDEHDQDTTIIRDVMEVDDTANDGSSQLGPVRKPRPSAVTQPQKGTEILPRMKSKVTRGLVDVPKRHGRKARIEHIYGITSEDLVPYAKNRDRWQHDYTLPSCFGPSAYHTDQMRHKESTDGWAWYTQGGGKDTFQRHQRLVPMEQQNADSYLSLSNLQAQHLVVGPLKEQQTHLLKAGACLRLSDMWSKTEERIGFIINVTAKVQSLDWLPNNDSHEQYLAVSTLEQEPHLRSQPVEDTPESKSSPAFTAASQYPTSIQIWRIADETALLSAVLCLDWGDPKQIKWCPMPGPIEDVPPTNLLAAIFFDGSLRVLDLDPRDLSGSASAAYIHVAHSAFNCVLPKDVLPTCLTWLSTQSIAIGCSNGHVAIFDLAAHLSSAKASAGANPQPWFYAPLHTTFILSLTSCYPSRPHLLLTSSLDGTVRLTDLRAPDQDAVTTLRSRIGTDALAWHDRMQSAISIDEMGVVKAHAIRRFFQSIEVGRLSAQAGDVKCSPVHSSILAGGLDGKVYVSNPMRRLTNMKQAEVWRQCWFEYQWRRPLEEKQIEVIRAAAAKQAKKASQSKTSQAGETNVFSGDNDMEYLRQPMGRFLDGHKLEQVAGPNVDQSKLSFSHHTIYEEGSAITQVAWNPNVKFGGWAAAGTGSGLVRIENLTLETGQLRKRARR